MSATVNDTSEIHSRRQRASERHRPLSPLGFEHDISSSSRGLEPVLPRRSRRREKRKRAATSQWKKLLWIKQPCTVPTTFSKPFITKGNADPDNYTDPSTFLDHMKRNPRLQPYEFWRLVADSTIIIQQVCSVIIFVCCFTGIFQERISPVTVVSWGSAATIIGWVAWDIWVGREADLANGVWAIQDSRSESTEDSTTNDGISASVARALLHPADSDALSDEYRPPTAEIYGDPLSSLSPRNQQRLATIKSAVLIYCAVLGMSPILKSLTLSTTSDSIWAISFWLIIINMFFFDYGGGVGAK
jgi:phosphatidylinositol N-acetylglucosaminyltransferase subunit C